VAGPRPEVRARLFQAAMAPPPGVTPSKLRPSWLVALRDHGWRPTVCASCATCSKPIARLRSLGARLATWPVLDPWLAMAWRSFVPHADPLEHGAPLPWQSWHHRTNAGCSLGDTHSLLWMRQPQGPPGRAHPSAT
jgi:hypothetical protein